MPASSIQIAKFLFEYKTPKEVGGTETIVEKVAYFTCKDYVAKFLGIYGFIANVASPTKTIAAYTRDQSLIGGNELFHNGAAATNGIPVSSYTRVIPQQTLRKGGKIAIITLSAKSLTTKAKSKSGYKTARFNFPSSTSLEEMGIALSMLFLKSAVSILPSATSNTSLIRPTWKTVAGTSYPFITDSTTLLALEAKYGVNVGTDAASDAAIAAAGGA